MALVVPTVLVVAFSCSPAQEPRASQPSPPPQRAMAPAPVPTDRMTERQAWLGVQAEPVRSDVAMQLPLRKGAGLVVMFVEAESPAEKAGLQRFDILEMVGDQFLMNVDQFNGLVKSEQPGAKVKLTWLRRGERKQAEVALGERLVPARRGAPDRMDDDVPPTDRRARARPEGRPEGEEGMAWREVEGMPLPPDRPARQRGDLQRREVQPGRERDAGAAARARLMEAVRDAVGNLPPEERDRVMERLMRALERDVQVEIDVEEWRGDGPRPPMPPMDGRGRRGDASGQAPGQGTGDAARDRKRDAQRDVQREERRSSSSSATIEDGSIRISINRRDQGPAEVRVEELDGTVLWEGHLEPGNAGTNGGLMDVPPEFRSQVEMLLRGG
ncbi:MAG: PDZ domain-containing protein [Planctomycetes bacterium]|nr:PDZ domain-containing protein [Planctomycetota bacterium]